LHVCPRRLHSFPTRRSSDLGQGGVRVLLGLLDQQAGGPGMDAQAVLNGVSKLLHMLSPDLVFLPGLGFQHVDQLVADDLQGLGTDRKSTRLNSSHVSISYAV